MSVTVGRSFTNQCYKIQGSIQARYFSFRRESGQLPCSVVRIDLVTAVRPGSTNGSPQANPIGDIP